MKKVRFMNVNLNQRFRWDSQFYIKNGNNRAYLESYPNTRFFFKLDEFVYVD